MKKAFEVRGVCELVVDGKVTGSVKFSNIKEFNQIYSRLKNLRTKYDPSMDAPSEVLDFMKDEVTVTGKADDKVPGADLYSMFKQWCLDNKLVTKVGRNSFYGELQQIDGVSKGMDALGRVNVFGVKIGQPADDSTDDLL